jgi:hypothetical protein
LTPREPTTVAREIPAALMAGRRVNASQLSMTSDHSTSTMAGAKIGLTIDMISPVIDTLLFWIGETGPTPELAESYTAARISHNRREPEKTL